MIELIKLYTRSVEELNINEIIHFNKEDIKGSEILEEFDVLVKGYVYLIEDEYQINCNILCDLFLPCSITLNPVLYKININYNDNIEQSLINSSKILDLKEFLWQNIVVEIPSKVVSEKAYDKELKGEGWALVDKDKPNNNPFVDLATIINKKG